MVSIPILQTVRSKKPWEGQQKGQHKPTYCLRHIWKLNFGDSSDGLISHNANLSWILTRNSILVLNKEAWRFWQVFCNWYGSISVLTSRLIYSVILSCPGHSSQPASSRKQSGFFHSAEAGSTLVQEASTVLKWGQLPFPLSLSTSNTVKTIRLMKPVTWTPNQPRIAEVN